MERRRQLQEQMDREEKSSLNKSLTVADKFSTSTRGSVKKTSTEVARANTRIDGDKDQTDSIKSKVVKNEAKRLGLEPSKTVTQKVSTGKENDAVAKNVANFKGQGQNTQNKVQVDIGQIKDDEDVFSEASQVLSVQRSEEGAAEAAKAEKVQKQLNLVNKIKGQANQVNLDIGNMQDDDDDFDEDTPAKQVPVKQAPTKQAPVKQEPVK